MSAVSNDLVRKYSEVGLFGQSLTIDGSQIIDSSGNVDIPGTLDVTGATTLDSDVTMSAPSSQDYKWLEGRGATILGLQSQASGSTATLDLYTADGDGTDGLRINLYSQGSPGDITNRERLRIHYLAADKALIGTEASGTGTLRPLHLQAGSNSSQLVLNTDGTVTFGSDININPSNTYTITNDTTDRNLDANSTTTAELADVLSTLIKDLGLDA